jgi:hypothetical protein
MKALDVGVYMATPMSFCDTHAQFLPTYRVPLPDSTPHKNTAVPISC